jgi:hypothetical protein|tara:strand:- start:49 stop:276 length:228 start_codon:yes stop_codon:yes gene_type:complete
MKNYQDIKNNLAKLNELDQKKVKDIINDLEKYTQKSQINQEGLKKLHDIQTQIVVFSQQYSDRLLQLLRQNHMID